MDPVTRRSFMEKAGAGVLGLGSLAGAETTKHVASFAKDGLVRHVISRCVTEWAYSSGKSYADPFNDVELDVIFRNPDGKEQRVPAFWAGEMSWRIRYAPPSPGRYTYNTVCSDTTNSDLHGQKGVLEVSGYSGKNRLRLHGALRVSTDHLHFEHEDGTPFFWLGDTWWMALCKRLSWPEEFGELTADRVKKGFTVIQIIAGLYPDMPPFDPRGANEAGYPWEKEYSRINPQYFDMADVRIQHLVENGLTPCVVGCWGYFLPIMGVKKLKQHWRYLVARWGSYPVVWCLAGEGTMPYYLSKTQAEDEALQKRGWTEIAKYVRSIDSYHRLVTIHPAKNSRDSVEDTSVLDFDMLQTGHYDRGSMSRTVDGVTDSLTRTPRMPVVDGETCYEGILDENREEMQRFMFWVCILSGAAGHTYGANGIWQVNTADQPYGPSPHGRCWGDTPWNVAYKLIGSDQLSLCTKFLSRYEWWRFEPHPEWVDPHWSSANYNLPYAAGIPGEVRLVFIPSTFDSPKIKNLESGTSYRAFFFDLRTGKEIPIGEIERNASGSWQVPFLPSYAQWVVVLRKV